jgi:hypothetical protein
VVVLVVVLLFPGEQVAPAAGVGVEAEPVVVAEGLVGLVVAVVAA